MEQATHRIAKRLSYKAAEIADVAAIAMNTKMAMAMPMHTAAAMVSPLPTGASCDLPSQLLRSCLSL